MKPRHKFPSATVLLACGLTFTACGGSEKSIQQNSAIETEATGPWNLNRAESGISFVTIKKGSVAEIGTFTAFEGTIAKDGTADFTIVIDSVNTNNETRDPRMRQFLFETDKHPYLKATAVLDLDEYTDMKIGERHTSLLSFDLDLHGVRDPVESYVIVTRLGSDKVLVENKSPIIVDAADFGLETGIEKLRDLAGLDGITPVVPVTFSLVFERR